MLISSIFNSVTAVAVLLLLVTVLVYSCVKELKTVSGKLALCFALSYLTIQAFFPILYIDPPSMIEFPLAFMFVMGMIFSFIWMSIMSFDIWWTLR